jgi:ribonuclease BN (tRNA processing enzyme)
MYHTLVLFCLFWSAFSIPCLEVVILGTGNPNPNGRAGTSNLIRYGDSATGCKDYSFVVDLGRGSLIQLSKLNRLLPENITAVFITHFHSDHTSDIFDFIQTRSLDAIPRPSPPSVFYVPAGGVSFEVEHATDPYVWDKNQRRNFAPSFNPTSEIHSFVATNEPQTVFSNGAITVDTIYVEHQMNNSCAYRFNTPAGSVVFTGDGRLGPPFNLHVLSPGASMVVTNPFLDTSTLTSVSLFPPFFPLMHMNSTLAGNLGRDINLPMLVLTHLMPGPGDTKFNLNGPPFPFGPCTKQMWIDVSCVYRIVDSI